MFKIKNNSTDGIKTYNLTLSNKSVTIVKTEKDFPIKDEIEITLSDSEIGANKKVKVDFSVTYNSGKIQSISSSSFNVALLNLNISTYGATKPMGISVSPIQNKTSTSTTIDKNYIMIQDAVAEYMRANPIQDIVVDLDELERRLSQNTETDINFAKMVGA